MRSQGRKYKIGEASELLGVPVTTLRSWEKAFPMLAPKKTRGGHREYSETDLSFLTRIIDLLKHEGRSIPSVRGILEKRPPLLDLPTVESLLLEVRKGLAILTGNDHEIGA
ncbi:MAG: MerR family transcriptional regulator [Nitrospirota bacterium]|nr:MerR family transcriptional regulator [Nitrospirota bacterium]